MRGNTNTTGVSENTGFELLPEGQYLFEIQEVGESSTRNGDPMAKLTLVVKDGQYKGRKVWDNIIIPYPNSPAIKILGRTKHFWHCIGEPYEGDVDWDTARWLFKSVVANIKHELIKEGSYAGKNKAVVSNYVLSEELASVTIDDPFAE